MNAGFNRMLGSRLRPLPATLIGLSLVVLIVVAANPLDAVLDTATKALALVLPVIGAAVVGGRRAAYTVAAAASAAFAYLLPPFGAARIALEQDLVAVVVFSIVAVLVSTVVARRIEILGEVELQRVALLRSVSHDFRTPLAAIRAASTELQDEELYSPEARRRMLTLIEEETERLDRLVTNLLDLSRIEAGMLEPRRQAVDLAELIDFCVARLRPLVSQARLEVNVDADIPILDADYTLLDQVITNLVENAARHSPPNGVVRLAAIAEAGWAIITVSDEGPGVPVAQRAVIFETFQAIGASAGSGVGLAICKAIVEAHSGTISVSDSLNGGAEFTVHLPIRGALRTGRG